MLPSRLQCSALLPLVLVLMPLSPIHAGDELASRIGEVLTRPEYKHSRWGLLVVDFDSGKTIYQHNAEELFAPASVTKLFTCAAALITFGPDYRFRTPVYRRGELSDGVLQGDLVLVAKGDPTLGGRTGPDGRLLFKDNDHTYASFRSTQTELTPSDPLAGLRELARQVRRSGVRRVEGDVLIDDRLFSHAVGSGSGPRLVTPIVVNDNVVDAVIAPGKAVGELAKVRLRPETGFIHVDVEVETVAAGKKPRINVERVELGRFVLRGRIPLDSKPLVRICPVADTALFARGLIIEALRREGVSIKASALARPTAILPDKDAYAGLARIARYESPPFSELLKVTLKVSHNLYASTMPLLIGARHGKRTLSEGLAQEGKILAELGVDVKAITLESGAGGGTCDHVTPRVTVQLLRAMSKRPDFEVYRTALPVLGVDGTLADVVAKDSPARGKVQAKTGTLTDTDWVNHRTFLRSKALAGVMTTASGRRLTFAFFVNNVPLPSTDSSSREGKTMGRLCEIVYQYAPGDRQTNK